MNIGFVNIYSWRPHVEHLYFLSEILKADGHEVFFLTCDSSISTCYAKELKGTGRLAECSKCVLGGVRSFSKENVTPIKSQDSELSDDVLEEITLSSSCTLIRTESETEWNDPEVVAFRDKLKGPAESAYASAKQWIEVNKLEAVICFNGRMDLTRAVTYACETLDIPFITHERAWFGDGLLLVPNSNCLSLKEQRKLAAEYAKKPLKKHQAQKAGKFLGERFLQRNLLEWRVYNKNPAPAPWPLKTSGKRILILPSSRNEFAGNKEWQTDWTDNTQAIDDFLDVYGFSYDQVVLRCHPNWAENVGRVSGNRPQELYSKWAEAKGVYCIEGSEKANTYDLIQQADLVIMNGGSSAVEAGACGKQVVCLGPAIYDASAFVQCFHSRQDMEKSPLWSLEPDEIRRLTLRFLYVSSNRFPQFVDYVIAETTTRYHYHAGADASRLIRLLRTGEIEADDPTFSDNDDEENAVINLLKNANWAELASYQPAPSKLPLMNINRRFGFRWVDGVRSRMRRGDR